ncbi:MAG: ankyrin repeat domain-containing protein [Nitrosomonas sp.]|nr:ankyrin repeat domain-containing protein [Nitrosomonas sp.]
MGNSPTFSQHYHLARVQVIVSGGLLFALEVLGWQLPIKVSWLEVDKLGTEELKVVSAAVLAYSLLRLIVEWCQTDMRCRTLSSSKFEFLVTILLGFTVLILYIFPRNALQLIVQLPLPSTLLVLMYGLIFGIATSTAIMDASLIRPKAEAIRLGLHRVPVATRSAFKMCFFVALIIIPITLFADEFKSPLDLIWPYLVFGPVILLATGGLWGTYFSRAKTAEGELLRDIRHRHMRDAVDQHDTFYQLGGWDRAAQVQLTPLAIAAIAGEVAKVEELLDTGDDPNQTTHLGWTPLMLAVAEGHSGVVDRLIEAGADVNAMNFVGRTALMFACRYGFKDIATKLLEHGAEPETMPISSEPNALMVAAAFGDEEIVKVLLDHGANPKARGEDGRTAVDYAQSGKNGKIAVLLRKKSR